MFSNISAIKAVALRNGSHFFDRATMRYFASRVGSAVYGGRIFLTSEQFMPSQGAPNPRKYTVRLVTDNGDIRTIGPFNELSREDAQRLAKLLAPLADEIGKEFIREEG